MNKGLPPMPIQDNKIMKSPGGNKKDNSKEVKLSAIQRRMQRRGK